MTAAYEFHPEARIDLRNITDFVSDDKPTAADRVLTKIHAATAGERLKPVALLDRNAVRA